MDNGAVADLVSLDGFLLTGLAGCNAETVSMDFGCKTVDDADKEAVCGGIHMLCNCVITPGVTVQAGNRRIQRDHDDEEEDDFNNDANKVDRGMLKLDREMTGGSADKSSTSTSSSVAADDWAVWV